LIVDEEAVGWLHVPMNQTGVALRGVARLTG
jgi:hypothetical protein